jgi:hypothetical protein
MPIPAFWSGAFHAFTEKEMRSEQLKNIMARQESQLRIYSTQLPLAKGSSGFIPFFQGGIRDMLFMFRFEPEVHKNCI